MMKDTNNPYLWNINECFKNLYTGMLAFYNLFMIIIPRCIFTLIHSTHRYTPNILCTRLDIKVKLTHLLRKR